MDAAIGLINAQPRPAACMRRLDAMKWKAPEDIRNVQDKITGELEKAFPRASDEHLDAMALQYFYKVLDDEDIERAVKVMMPKTMSKAVQLALKIQHLSKKKDSKKADKKDEPKAASNPPAADTPAHEAKPGRRNRREDMKDVVCPFCTWKGHTEDMW